MLNELVVASVVPFSGTVTPDKNGEESVMLQVIAGKCPNRNTLSGTVAKRAGLEVGKTYLMNVREQGYDKQFGTDYTFIRVKELETGEDIINASIKLGPAVLFKVERPEEFQGTYERKSVAVEGLRTKRIKEGKYIPSIQTSATDHSTAKKVIEGSSTESDTDFQPEEEEDNQQQGKRGKAA